jgi:hypothetical protein
LYQYEIQQNFIQIEIPNIVDLISNVISNYRYEIISGDEVLPNTVLVKRYKKVYIKVYSHSFKLSFDVTLVKPNIRSNL